MHVTARNHAYDKKRNGRYNGENKRDAGLAIHKNTKRSNVGVDAAGSNCITDEMSMTSPLIPLASNDLFDCGPTSRVTRQRIQVAPTCKQPGNQLGFVATSFNLAAARSGASCRTSNARRRAGN